MLNHCPLSFRLISIMAILCISVASALAQHDGTGSTAGGGSLGGPTKPKTTTKPATTKPTTSSTRRKTPPTTTPTARRTAPRPTTPTTSTADSYEKQGDEQYDAKEYNDAVQSYMKALQINPSSAHANYRIGWIYNEQEQYAQALTYLT